MVRELADDVVLVLAPGDAHALAPVVPVDYGRLPSCVLPSSLMSSKSITPIRTCGFATCLTVLSFRGKNYLIQGWDWSEADSGAGPHIEVFELGENFERDYEFRYDGASRGECTEAFLAAKPWDGMAFAEAESEIEWVG